MAPAESWRVLGAGFRPKNSAIWTIGPTKAISTCLDKPFRNAPEASRACSNRGRKRHGRRVSPARIDRELLRKAADVCKQVGTIPGAVPHMMCKQLETRRESPFPVMAGSPESQELSPLAYRARAADQLGTGLKSAKASGWTLVWRPNHGMPSCGKRGGCPHGRRHGRFDHDPFWWHAL